MESKKVVVWEEGYLNWLRPKHDDYGRLSIGMYGMLGDYVESLGGELTKGESLKANFSRRQTTSGINWIWSGEYGAPGSLGDPSRMGILNFE